MLEKQWVVGELLDGGLKTNCLG